MEAFISELPKAELHVHIEGTMEPELLMNLSLRNSIHLPYTLEEAKAKRLNYENLQDFLAQYYDACKVLITEQDFYELAMEYFRKAVENNVKHAEVFFDPQAHTNRGIAFNVFMEGFHRAQVDASTLGLSSKWILCILRDLSEDEAIKTFQEASHFSNYIGGIGLDSDEIGHPPHKFKRAFKIAADLGLCGTDKNAIVAHAASEADPSYVIDALSSLKVKRIDHGVRSIEDPFLCRFLANSRVPLTVCPNSNVMCHVKSRFFPDRNIVKELLDLNIVVTINSDDPAFFGGYINANYMTFVNELSGLSILEIKTLLSKLAKNSFEASFLSEAQKSLYYEMVDSLLKSN